MSISHGKKIARWAILGGVLGIIALLQQASKVFGEYAIATKTISTLSTWKDTHETEDDNKFNLLNSKLEEMVKLQTEEANDIKWIVKALK